MLPRRDQVLVLANILHIKSLVLFCVAFCFQGIHASEFEGVRCGVDGVCVLMWHTYVHTTHTKCVYRNACILQHVVCIQVLFPSPLLPRSHTSLTDHHCDSMSDTGSVCVTITNPPRANITDSEVMDMRCRWDTTQYNFFRWTFNGSIFAPERDGIFNSEMTFNTLSIRGSPQVHGEYRCWVTRKTNQAMREFAPLFIYYFRKCLVCTQHYTYM